jgi:hypothetical protein
MDSVPLQDNKRRETGKMTGELAYFSLLKKGEDHPTNLKMLITYAPGNQRKLSWETGSSFGEFIAVTKILNFFDIQQ